MKIRSEAGQGLSERIPVDLENMDVVHGNKQERN